MQSLFLVNVIPPYLGEAGQVQDKLLESKIYTSKWSVWCVVKAVCKMVLLLVNEKCSQLEPNIQIISLISLD